MDYEAECPCDCRVVKEMKRKAAKSNRRSTKIKRRKNFLNRRFGGGRCCLRTNCEAFRFDIPYIFVSLQGNS